jgi:hypothetical protein
MGLEAKTSVCRIAVRHVLHLLAPILPPTTMNDSTVDAAATATGLMWQNGQCVTTSHLQLLYGLDRRAAAESLCQAAVTVGSAATSTNQTGQDHGYYQATYATVRSVEKDSDDDNDEEGKKRRIPCTGTCEKRPMYQAHVHANCCV